MRQLCWSFALAAIFSLAAGSSLAATALGTPVSFTVTQYCQGTHTKSGLRVRSGIAAADPAYVPLGSVVHVASPNSAEGGIYTVLDTGPKVTGRHLDLYVADCGRARKFGRQLLHVTILRLGWNPRTAALAP